MCQGSQSIHINNENIIENILYLTYFGDVSVAQYVLLIYMLVYWKL